MEAAELAVFMFLACAFTVAIFHPGSPVSRLIPSPMWRRGIMGVAMGVTALSIIRSPLGKRSGAHFNPAVTLTYYWLGLIEHWDMVSYCVAQFAGGAAGMVVARAVFGSTLADPAVAYAVTVPGKYGVLPAFVAEGLMAFVLMSMVLTVSNTRQLANYTSYLVSILIMLYIFFLAPVSGFSLNPARTASSGLLSHVWTAWWIYFTAPVIGMIAAAKTYVGLHGKSKVYCAKLDHSGGGPCVFRCRFAELVGSSSPQ